MSNTADAVLLSPLSANADIPRWGNAPDGRGKTPPLLRRRLSSHRSAWLFRRTA